MPPAPHNPEAAWLWLFADETRLKLIRALATGEKFITELAKVCEVEVLLLQHHLRIMKLGGLVTPTRDGRFVIYSLTAARAVGGQLEFVHASGARVFIPTG